jgi:hypothetical protein
MINTKNENYEAQKDEVELLKNILFEQLEVLEELPFILEISVKPDIVDTPIISLKVKVSLLDDYPNVEPKYDITDESNILPSIRLKQLNENIKQLFTDNQGFPVIYQMYELIKEFINEQEDQISKNNLSKAVIEDEIRRKKEKYLDSLNPEFAETKTFTPVTKENFEEWFKKFYGVRVKSKAKLEMESRQSGREYFMNLKNKGIEIEGDDEKDDDIGSESNTTGENALFYDADAFDENIDDIDFDQEGVDY